MHHVSSGSSGGSSDVAALSRYHEFVRDDAKDRDNMSRQWEVRMARRYYEKLYKEYVLADMSNFRAGKLGLRWRLEDEVLGGVGKDICGTLRCGEGLNLQTFEVPFSYEENGISKSELVKLRTCQACSEKLRFIRQYGRQKPQEEVVSQKKRKLEGNDEGRRNTSKKTKSKNNGERRGGEGDKKK